MADERRGQSTHAVRIGAVAAHEIVRIPASERPYYVDATVRVPSNRRIEATGATVALLPGTRVLMLRNEHAPDGTLAPIPPGSRDRNIKLCRFASANAVLGIVLNRFNVSMIAFNYTLPADERYFPSIWEVCISIFVVTLIVTVYRFIVYHMPVLYEPPGFKDAH